MNTDSTSRSQSITPRSEVLLRAAFDLLAKQRDSGYVLDLMGETAFYDDAECDGSCLMDDIANELDLDASETQPLRPTP